MRNQYEDKIDYHNRKFHSLANTDNGESELEECITEVTKEGENND